jgi:hypothetical protein
MWCGRWIGGTWGNGWANDMENVASFKHSQVYAWKHWTSLKKAT